MCKRPARFCTELGDDSAKWPRESLLAYPKWFDGQLDLFAEAVRRAAAGDLPVAVELMERVRNSELNAWYREHALNSGIIRRGHFGPPPPKTSLPGTRRDPAPTRMVAESFKRDRYQCRYCGLRVVDKAVMKAFQGMVGIDRFPMPKPDAERHGVALVFMPSHDHVGPRSVGGLHSLENLVTACWSCQFGKWGYTLEELGVDDPRNRSPKETNWDGLVSLIPSLNRR
ncbi:MAG: HNH endonuclease [Proteobacteria bacterium]|nr:HNH endonuclease [Pseudomonadota bacterium]